MARISRVPTGIPNLDGLIGGGFPRGSVILLTGDPGVGKTIFGLQFLYAGAVEYGEPGLYLTAEEFPEELKLTAQQFNWDLNALEEGGKLYFFDLASGRVRISTKSPTSKAPFDPDTVLVELLDMVRKTRVQRVVVDSLPAVLLAIDDARVARRFLHRMISAMKILRATTLLISESYSDSTGPYLHLRSSEFLASGLIRMYFEREGDKMVRKILVQKMRNTPLDLKPRTIEITSRGLVIIVF